jgi:hypothetical protein
MYCFIVGTFSNELQRGFPVESTRVNENFTGLECDKIFEILLFRYVFKIYHIIQIT